MKQFIQKYKKLRIYRHLSRQYISQYAFIGVGYHSLNNLYPVLDYLRVSVKYIVTASKKTVDMLNRTSGKYIAVNDLEKVLEDKDIRGVFISASPESHYSLISSALKHSKHVFVEKPPCRNITELESLISLQENSQKEVLIGLQRRYAPACVLLKEKLNHPLHYTYRYCTGPYPDGSDVLSELFIHPVDLLIFLFGEATLISCIQTRGTLLLQLRHSNQVTGAVELSTDYSWQMAIEQMTVVEKRGIYELNNLSELLYKSKPGVIGKIPLEKILPTTPVTKVLFHQNMFQPIMQHNNLYINGFYSELDTFVSICEGVGKRKNSSGLSALRLTFALLDEIRRRIEESEIH